MSKIQHEIVPVSLEIVKEGEVSLLLMMTSEWKSQRGTLVKAGEQNCGRGALGLTDL